LDAAGIEARPVWKPLHRQPVFAGSEYFSHADGDSVSDTVFATGICLPSGPDVTEAVQDRVIEEFRIALEGRRERTAS
jgi:pyridoxal phosphate-dependent aminotransferase EpsN